MISNRGATLTGFEAFCSEGTRWHLGAVLNFPKVHARRNDETSSDVIEVWSRILPAQQRQYFFTCARPVKSSRASLG